MPAYLWQRQKMINCSRRYKEGQRSVNTITPKMSSESQKSLDLPRDCEEIACCLHYQEKKDLEKKLGFLTAKKLEVSGMIETVEKELEDFENFFDIFGAENQSNAACQLIELENEKKWKIYYDLGEEQVDLNSQIYDVKELLQDVEKQARAQSCFCVRE